ncbi:MAG: hypothetical protein ACI8P9_004855 [Parasphingorhabdus sp.]|jgi:hypothetical protein
MQRDDAGQSYHLPTVATDSGAIELLLITMQQYGYRSQFGFFAKSH